MPPASPGWAAVDLLQLESVITREQSTSHRDASRSAKTSRPAARHHCAVHVLELTGALPEGDTMSTAVIGATGRVGSEIVRGLLARGEDPSRRRPQRGA